MSAVSLLESREQRYMEAINIIIISSALCYIREKGMVGKVSTHRVLLKSWYARNAMILESFIVKSICIIIWSTKSIKLPKDIGQNSNVQPPPANRFRGA